jgi:addiction module HigA family antidote
VTRSFRDRDAERLFERHRIKRLGPEVQRVALRKLRMLDAAVGLEDLRVPPGNRLERLHGDRAGQHSIRVNDRWRICFHSQNGDAYDVEIVDLPLTEENEMAKRLAPVHPGEILLEEFLEPLDLSQYRLAKEIHVPARRINEIVHGTRAVSADTALRLARYFGTSERFWMNLQAQWDLDTEYDRVGDRIAREITPRAS